MSKSVKHARPLTAATHSFAGPINDFVLSFEYWGVVFWCSVPDSPASKTCWRFPMAVTGSISAASLDVSYIATPEACRRSVLVSLWRPQLRRWCGFRGKGRLNLPGHGSTKFARPLGCFLLLCYPLLRPDDSCRNRRQIDLSLSISSGGNKFAKGLAFVPFVPRLIFD